MRNDDPDYIRHLEQALEAAEVEIKYLSLENAKLHAELYDQHMSETPTFMGEPK